MSWAQSLLEWEGPLGSAAEFTTHTRKLVGDLSRRAASVSTGRESLPRTDEIVGRYSAAARQILMRLVARYRAGQVTNVLVFDGLLQTTIDILAKFDCKIDVVDVWGYSGAGIELGHSTHGPASRHAIFSEVEPRDVIWKYDIVLAWDGIGFDDLYLSRNLLARLRRGMKPGAMMFGIIRDDIRGGLSPLYRFGIDGDFRLLRQYCGRELHMRKLGAGGLQFLSKRFRALECFVARDNFREFIVVR